MSTFYLAVTIDTDPDGLNVASPDRSNLSWDGLHFAMEHFHNSFPDYPLTWFVRADRQLDYAYGSSLYLFDTYSVFWTNAVRLGDEIAWHPHLYTLPDDDSAPEIITDSTLAVPELQRQHELLKGLPFDLRSFRMGEGWHTAETLNLIETLGYNIDSTAIPGRDDSASGHPRNWRGTPEHPYYPDMTTPRLSGNKRQILEVPMTTWTFQASYDKAPRLRYMNPCIHPELWDQALDSWLPGNDGTVNTFLVMILHPNEVMPHDEPDMLYAYSLESMKRNLQELQTRLENNGHSVMWTTVQDGAKHWLDQHS